MVANYLIGLREGLEAALVVGILVAYLVQSGNRRRLSAVWAGVGAAIGISLGFGALLTFASSASAAMSFAAKEALGGILSVVAVAFVTWMIFWMRRTARHLRSELHTRLDAALAMGTGALVLTALLAVGREGLETSLFLWTAVQATGQTVQPLIGAALGLLTAVVIGYLLYRRAVRLNLATFFRWTGVGLVVVAAGVLAYGVHDLQEAGLLPGLGSLAFDVSGVIPPDSWYGTLLKGVLSFSPQSTWLQVATWLAYLVPVMTLFFLPTRAGRLPAPASPAPRPVTRVHS
ncbi:MAG: FTR1 family protein [Actinomycetota bacterium]|nr:FTR1 family protein [Actinomycetota bacterium]